MRAALLAAAAGVDGITRASAGRPAPYRDADIAHIKEQVALPLNFEMAATDEMVAIALATRPHACCLVPERREERTTEAGWMWPGRPTIWLRRSSN